MSAQINTASPIQKAMCYWGSFDGKWYRNGAAFNLTGIMDEYNVLIN